MHIQLCCGDTRQAKYSRWILFSSLIGPFRHDIGHLIDVHPKKSIRPGKGSNPEMRIFGQYLGNQAFARRPPGGAAQANVQTDAKIGQKDHCRMDLMDNGHSA